MIYKGYKNLALTKDEHPTFTVDVIFDDQTVSVTLNYADMIMQYAVDEVRDVDGNLVTPAVAEIIAPRFNLRDQSVFDSQMRDWATAYAASRPQPKPTLEFSEGTA